MINLETVKSILEVAVNAPSGDNSQPWSFEFKNGALYIFNNPERDIPFYNFEQRGSYVAHGGLLENIKICVPHFGYQTDIQIFPDTNEPNLTTTVKFTDITPVDDPLFSSIPERASNRHHYKNTPLTSEQKNDILNSTQEVGGGKIYLIEDQLKKIAIGKALSANERTVLETKAIHNIFFSHVVWTAKEERQKRTGLFVKTLEMNPIQRLIFKLCSHWPFMKLGVRLGLSKFIASENAKLYSHSGALCLITVPSTSSSDFVLGGRLTQRIWLKAVKNNLSAQPVTGVLFLAHRILANQADFLAKEHQDLVMKAYNDLRELFGVKNDIMAMLLRIGQAPTPSARSSKFSPKI